MSVKLLSQNEAITIIQKRIISREWWIIPLASPSGIELSKLIEAECYDGHGEDFDMIYMSGVGGLLVSAMAIARKTCCNRNRMSKLLRINVPVDRDVLIAADTPIEFLRWMTETFDGAIGEQN